MSDKYLVMNQRLGGLQEGLPGTFKHWGAAPGDHCYHLIWTIKEFSD